MQAVILAGGLGTRISEETSLKPKPMVEIGDKPILWHIMKIYHEHNIKDFIICLGYKGYVIKEYFANYHLHNSDVTFDFKNNKTTIHNNNSEDWTVTLVETGQNSMTGSRVKKIKDYIKGDNFCLTYGDGVSNVDIKKLVDFHKSENKIATLTAVKPSGRFGALKIDQDGKTVNDFQEKPAGDGNYINGGFFVLSKKVFDYLGDGDDVIFEQDPLKNLAKDGQLSCFKHHDFWHAMDTQRDKFHLDELLKNNEAPWKVW